MISRPQARTARRVASAKPVVAGEHVVEAFLVQHVDRRRRGRAASGSPACRGRSRSCSWSACRPRPRTTSAAFEVLAAASALSLDRVERHAGRQHQALLRAADGDVDAPFVVAVVGRGERGDGVDHEQRRMAGGVDRLADLGDRREAAGRGLVVQDADRLDLVLLVLAQLAPRSPSDRRRCASRSSMNSGLRPSFSAIFFHSVANWPVSTISTRSPGESVLTSAASQAPVPVAV